MMDTEISQEAALLDTLGRRNRRLSERACPACNRSFRPVGSASKYCSRPCMWSRNGGQNRTDKFGEWINQDGYITGAIRKDGKRHHVRVHRIIMEQHLGRQLLPSEDVHHINGVKTDNRVENLAVLDHSDHARLTRAERDGSTSAARENEVLRELGAACRNQVSRGAPGWVRPMDCGGKNRSAHSYCLSKLVQMGLAEEQPRGGLTRRSKLYRITAAGIAAIALAEGRAS